MLVVAGAVARLLMMKLQMFLMAITVMVPASPGSTSKSIIARQTPQMACSNTAPEPDPECRRR